MRPGRALSAVLLVLLAGSRADAQPVSIRCQRLDADQRSELRARIRLVLRSAVRASRPISVELRCGERSAALYWESAFMERIPVDEDEGLVEGALDALERRLAQLPPPRLRDPGETRAIQPPAQRPEEPRRGGIALGVRVEPIAGPVYVGPRLELALPAGPFEVFALGSLRSAPRDSVLVGSELGLSLGAPYRSDWFLGGAASFGVEALTAIGSGAPEGSRSDHAAVGSIGPRAAFDVGRLTFYVGADYRRRFADVTIERPDVTLGRDSIGIVGGVVIGLDLDVPRRSVSLR